MRTHMFIIVRYSLLTSDGSAWIIGRQERNSYIESLFSPDRLAIHEFLFENVALPSIASQSFKPTKDNVTMVILTSEDLPRINFNNLIRITSPYDWILVKRMTSQKTQSEIIEEAIMEQLERFDEEVCYCTIRLDDDDALRRNYLERVSRYCDRIFAGHALSFGKGVVGIYNNDYRKFEEFYEYYEINNAQGLCFINIYDPTTQSTIHKYLTVYHVGNHRKTDQRVPTIVDSRSAMYIRTVHQASDTYNNIMKKIQKYTFSPRVSIDESKKLFAINDLMYFA